MEERPHVLGQQFGFLFHLDAKLFPQFLLAQVGDNDRTLCLSEERAGDALGGRAANAGHRKLEFSA